MIMPAVQESPRQRAAREDREQIRRLCKIGRAAVLEDLLTIKATPDEAIVIILRLREYLPPSEPIPIYRAGCLH